MTALWDGMRERRRSEWSIPFARSLTKQIARKASSHEGCGKIGRSPRCTLGIVDSATTCVMHLVIIPILPATRSARTYSEVPNPEELARGPKILQITLSSGGTGMEGPQVH
jgi:hypothetical protein